MSILDQQPTVIRTADQPTAVVRERVPMANLTDFFGRVFGAVMAATQAQNASPTGPSFAMYNGRPTDTVDVEAGFPVAPDCSASGEAISGLLPASDALEAVHKGTLRHLGTDVRAHP